MCVLFLMLLRLPKKPLNHDLGFDCADTRAGIDAEKMNEHHGSVDVGEGASRLDRGHVTHAEAEFRSDMRLCEGTALSFQLKDVTNPIGCLAMHAVDFLRICQRQFVGFSARTPLPVGWRRFICEKAHCHTNSLRRRTGCLLWMTHSL